MNYKLNSNLMQRSLFLVHLFDIPRVAIKLAVGKEHLEDALLFFLCRQDETNALPYLS